MRAMVTPQFGGPDLFEERDAERPRPGPGEVLVRVIAASTNPVDAKFRSSGDAMGLETPIILGSGGSRRSWGLRGTSRPSTGETRRFSAHFSRASGRGSTS